MKLCIHVLVFLFSVVICFIGTGFTLTVKQPIWGFFAHKKVNELAIYTLPRPLQTFYLDNQHRIVQLAVAADQRRHSSVDEAAKHYIDLDHYPDSVRFNMPHTWFEAVTEYEEDSLLRHGIVPYAAQKTYYLLRKAWRRRDRKMIIKYSADLGHYVADAHVPLHTTSNYDGQHTDQEGIHAFWESQLPETFYDQYELWAGKASFQFEIDSAIWQAIYKAHKLVPMVLETEKALSKEFKGNDYAFQPRGTILKMQHSPKFAIAYHREMEGMVEDQLLASIKLVGDLWYSAWIEAGQPPPASIK